MNTFTEFSSSHTIHYIDLKEVFPTLPMANLKLCIETRTEIIADPAFTLTTLQLAIDSFIVTKVTGLKQLLVPTLSYPAKPHERECEEYEKYEEFQPPSCSCLSRFNVPLPRETRSPSPTALIEQANLSKALKLEPLAGIGSPPGTVNLVNGITYVSASGIVISYGFGFLLSVCEPSTPQCVWRVESSEETGLPVLINGTGKLIPLDTYGGIFLFDDGSRLLVTQLDQLLGFTVRYIFPTSPNLPGSGLTKRSIQGFDPTRISVFLNQANCVKVQAGTLADIFQGELNCC
jgi:hypothetical protein